jgi:hypothetical protein
MKIALFGDSFGESGSNNVKHWFDIVCDQLNYQSANFSKNGTHLYYSYNKFLENHSDYDKVVVIASSPRRFPVPINIGNETFCVPSTASVENIERIKQDTLTIEEVELLKNLKAWFLVSDFNFMNTTQNLLLKDILNRRKDVILIPVFPDSLGDDILKKTGLSADDCLNKIKTLQLKNLGYWSDEPVYLKYHDNYDLLTGHFTEEINQKFSEIFYERLVTGTWKSFNLDFVKHKFSFKDYYKEIK